MIVWVPPHPLLAFIVPLHFNVYNKLTKKYNILNKGPAICHTFPTIPLYSSYWRTWLLFLGCCSTCSAALLWEQRNSPPRPADGALLWREHTAPEPTVLLSSLYMAVYDDRLTQLCKAGEQSFSRGPLPSWYKSLVFAMVTSQLTVASPLRITPAVVEYWSQPF